MKCMLETSRVLLAYSEGSHGQHRCLVYSSSIIIPIQSIHTHGLDTVQLFTQAQKMAEMGGARYSFGFPHDDTFVADLPQKHQLHSNMLWVSTAQPLVLYFGVEA